MYVTEKKIAVTVEPTNDFFFTPKLYRFFRSQNYGANSINVSSRALILKISKFFFSLTTRERNSCINEYNKKFLLNMIVHN